MNMINTQHPQWTAFWNSKIEFTKPTPEINQCWAEMEDQLLDFPGYDRAWLFIDAHGGQYLVAHHNGSYGTLMMGMMGGEARDFPTLEDAAKAAFGDWFPENDLGSWNEDVTELTVDGEWLIREVQS